MVYVCVYVYVYVCVGTCLRVDGWCSVCGWVRVWKLIGCVCVYVCGWVGVWEWMGGVCVCVWEWMGGLCVCVWVGTCVGVDGCVRV